MHFYSDTCGICSDTYLACVFLKLVAPASPAPWLPAQAPTLSMPAPARNVFRTQGFEFHLPGNALPQERGAAVRWAFALSHCMDPDLRLQALIARYQLAAPRGLPSWDCACPEDAQIFREIQKVNLSFAHFQHMLTEYIKG